MSTNEAGAGSSDEGAGVGDRQVIGKCNICGPLYADQPPCGHTAMFIAGYLTDTEPFEEPAVLGEVTTIPGPDSVAHTFRSYPGRRAMSELNQQWGAEDARRQAIDADPGKEQGIGEIVVPGASSNEPGPSAWAASRPRPEGPCSVMWGQQCLTPFSCASGCRKGRGDLVMGDAYTFSIDYSVQLVATSRAELREKYEAWVRSLSFPRRVWERIRKWTDDKVWQWTMRGFR